MSSKEDDHKPEGEYEPATPTCKDDFKQIWASAILQDWWADNDFDSNKVEIKAVNAALNGLQGLLSTTYVVDVDFLYEGSQETKSIFVKVPLRSDEGTPTFHEANLREFCMFKEILPKLQKFLEEKCTDVLQLPIPELVYCNYIGDGKSDIFVMENLLASDYKPFSDSLLTKEYLKSCLECMAQLHGTGLAYQKQHQASLKNKSIESLGSELKHLFPSLNEQVQIQDVLSDKNNRKCLKRNLIPFLKYLQHKDQGLSNYTAFLAKTEKNIIKILQRAGSTGILNLVTLCHGDAKPDNFLFRKIEIELDELSCEGLEAILIDWQQTFIGSVTNDLMWMLPPFLERQADNGCTLEFAVEYYFNQMKLVLESFGKGLEDFGLKDDSKEFQSILKSGFLLEFFSVIIINPILKMNNPTALRKWHRKVQRHEESIKNGRQPRAPADPREEDIVHNEQFGKFVNLYCKVAHILGVFTQVGNINVDIVRENMFREEDEKDEAEDNEDDDIYRDEEEPLTDEEFDQPESKELDQSQAEDGDRPNVLARIVAWFLNIFGFCKKKQ